jgi:predicted amidohydrolase
VGLIEKVPASGAGPPVEYYNAAALLSPKGEIECRYRKVNPWPRGEATWARKGDRLAFCDTEFGRLGLMICFDVHTEAERLKAAGVTTILYPIAWVDDDPLKWFDERLPERVKEWGVNLVGANWSLEKEASGPKAWLGYGHSRIIRGDGVILARGSSTGNAVLYADLPLPAKRP